MSKTLAITLFFSHMLYCSGEFILAYTAIGIHELAHALMCIKLNIAPEGLCVNAFGMKLTIPRLNHFREKILIYSSGPAVSLLMYFIINIFKSVFAPDSYYLYFFSLANLSAFVINMIPVPPLDGASILKAVLAKHLGIIKGNRVLKRISAFFCGILLNVNIIFLILGVFNPGLFLFLIFAFNGIYEEKIILAREEKAVLSGEMHGAKRIKLIKCDAESELLSLASFISYDYDLLIAVFSEGRFLGEIRQDEILRGMNVRGALCTVGEYLNKKQVLNKKIKGL